MPIAQLQAETARALGIYTWATKPPAAGNAGTQIRVSDRQNQVYISDGDAWRLIDETRPFAYGGVVVVPPFACGAMTYAGGSIDCPADGVWYVGVDLFDGLLHTLPRLGHTGWVPVARAVRASGIITDCSPISPVMPKTRLPNFRAKAAAGAATSTLIIGSSLTSGNGANYWPGMVFSAGSANYQIPGAGMSYYGQGGAPNAHQMGHFGRRSLSRYSGPGLWYPGPINYPQVAYSRSAIFSAADLVVLTTLANGGDKRLELIEVMARRIVDMGLEGILCTDNPQGAPFADYAAMTSALLYVDGQAVFDAANYVGLEVADTAAYMVEAAFRYPAVALYGDSIHPTSNIAPAGPGATPTSGGEVWARAVRSAVGAIPTARESHGGPNTVPRMVKSTRDPGDAQVILPKDETYVRFGLTNKGTLINSPGTTSMSRRYAPETAGSDYLVLTVGQEFAIPGIGMTGCGLVILVQSGDSAAQFTIKRNSTVLKTVTCPTSPTSETYVEVMSADEYATTYGGNINDVLVGTVTSGTLRIAAIVAMCSDQTWVTPENIQRVGTWVNANYANPQARGIATDTAGDYAYLQTDRKGKRVYWLVANKANSKTVTIRGREVALTAQSASGYVAPLGGLEGRNGTHSIMLETNQSNSDQATNGYGLQVCGAIVVNDR